MRICLRKICIVIFLLASGLVTAQQSWHEIPIPRLSKFTPQEPKRFQLPNGMIVFLQEDHELPLISGSAYIKGGSSTEPASKIGMLSIYASSWRTSGTEKKTGDQLDDELEALAAKVETGAGIDTTSATFNCLKQNFDQVFDDFVDVVEHPVFREDKIAIAK